MQMSDVTAQTRTQGNASDSPSLVPPVFALSHLGPMSKMRTPGEHCETIASVSQIADKPTSLHLVTLLSGGHEQDCTIHCAASHGYFVLSFFEIMDKHVLQLPTVTIWSSLLYVPLIKREPTTMEDCSLRVKLFASLCDVMCAPLGSGSHSWEKT